MPNQVDPTQFDSYEDYKEYMDYASKAAPQQQQAPVSAVAQEMKDPDTTALQMVDPNPSAMAMSQEQYKAQPGQTAEGLATLAAGPALGLAGKGVRAAAGGMAALAPAEGSAGAAALGFVSPKVLHLLQFFQRFGNKAAPVASKAGAAAEGGALELESILQNSGAPVWTPGTGLVRAAGQSRFPTQTLEGLIKGGPKAIKQSSSTVEKVLPTAQGAVELEGAAGASTKLTPGQLEEIRSISAQDPEYVSKMRSIINR
jgi:hypothetical protein